MTPLDLTDQPPRPPRDELDGLIFLPRSIDKVRATLPGGNIGAYQIARLTQSMLDELGVTLDVFTLAVAAFLREHARPGSYDRWNAFISTCEPRGGNRAEALTVFPWLGERPDLVLILDVLTEDDRRTFTQHA